MQVSKVFIVHKHKSICNINDMFSCHFLGLVELVDFEHPTLQGFSSQYAPIDRVTPYPMICRPYRTHKMLFGNLSPH